METWHKTGSNGFFHFTDLPVKLNKKYGNAEGPFRRLQISKYGYNTIVFPPFNFKPWNLLYGQLKDIKDIKLIPKGKIKGKVVDEYGHPLEAFITVDKGAKYKTQQEAFQAPGEFKMLAESGTSVPILVEPMSSKYPTWTFYRDIHVSNGSTQNIGTLVIKTKKHRARVYVYDENGNSISGQLVKIGDNIGQTNSRGFAVFEFASQADNFLMEVIKETYEPVQKTIHLPNLTYSKIIKISLSRGRTIVGKVLDDETSSPIAGAKIFANVSEISNHPILFEAVSDANGNYQLKGIPMYLSYLDVTAIKEGASPIYAGKTQNLDLNPNYVPGHEWISSTTKQYDFRLKPAGQWAFTDIWGFPAIITNLRTAGNQAFISGYLHRIPAAPGISTDAAIQIVFRNVTFKIDANGKPVPAQNTLELDMTEIPTSINSSFKAKLQSKPTYVDLYGGLSFPIFDNLELVKDHNVDKASISGLIKLDNAGFKFSYDFDGNFYLGRDENTVVNKAFSSSAVVHSSSSPNSAFSVFDIKENQAVDIEGFRLFGFGGSAAKSTSLLDRGNIYLETTIHTNIPKCKPADLKMKVGKIVITNTDINFQQSRNQQKLAFKLEKWDVKATKPWIFNKKQESFFLPEALILTGGMDAKVKNMRIRPDELSEGELATTGGISLGGVIDIQLKSGIKPLFFYDEGAGGGHYRINLEGASTSGRDVWVQGLAGLPKNKRIYFSSFSLRSDNKKIISISQKVKFFDALDVELNQIMTGEGFATFMGNPVLNIPGERNFSPTGIKYTSPKDYSVVPFSGRIEIPGFVDFVLDNTPFNQNQTAYQILDKNGFVAYGDFYVLSKSQNDAQKIKIRGKLTRDKTNCRFDIIKVNAFNTEGNTAQKVVFGDKNSSMTITEGGLSLINGQYEYLKFDALPESYDGIGGKQNKMHFEVSGAVKANSDELQVSDIDVGIGTMSMQYVFSEQSLTGTLHVTQHIKMGYCELTDAMFTIRFDHYGYYLRTLADIKLLNYPTPMLGGFLIGNSSHVQEDHMLDLTRRFTVNPGSLPDQIKNNEIHGIFLGAEQRLFNISPLLIPSPLLVPMYISGSAGLGAYFNFEFGHSTDMELKGYGFGNISGSVNLLACEFCVAANSYIDIDGHYINGDFSMSACGTAGLEFQFCKQSLGFQLKAEASYESSKFNVSLGLGNCGGNAHTKKSCGN